jgi:hypothetical protein
MKYVKKALEDPIYAKEYRKTARMNAPGWLCTRRKGLITRSEPAGNSVELEEVRVWH